MRTIISFCLCVLSALGSIGHAEVSTDAEVRNEFLGLMKRVREGVAPPDDKEGLQQVQKKLYHDFTTLRYLLNLATNVADKTSPSCRRFGSIALHLVQILLSETSDFSKHDFLGTNRIQIGIVAFDELSFLLTSGAEGGYSVLDWNRKESCNFVNRKDLIVGFQKAIENLKTFFNLAFGSLSLTQMKEAQRNLLSMAIEDESVDNRNFWLVAGAGTAASFFLWEFGPVAALATTRAVLGYTPAILAIPAVAYGIKVSAVLAEGAAFTYAGEITTSTIDPPKINFGSWDEHMNAIETFVEAPRSSPALQLALLTRVHSLLLSEVYAWTKAHELVIGEDPTKLELDILSLTSGSDVDEEVRQISDYIEKKFKYRLSCAAPWGITMSRFRCLWGMQSISDALFSQRIKIPPEVISVRVSEKGVWQDLDTKARMAFLSVPYDLSKGDFERYISYQLMRNDYRQRVETLEHLEDLRSQLQESVGKEIEIDEGLSNQAAEFGLSKLSLLANHDVKIFAGAPEVLRISNRFLDPYEQNLKLKEDLDASASLKETTAFLREVAQALRVMMNDQNSTQRFFAQRSEFEAVQKEISEGLHINNIDCSPDKLTFAQCTIALKKVNLFFTNNQRIAPPKIDVLMIAGPGEIKGTADYLVESGKVVFIIRQDFRFRQLERWFEDYGWVRK